VLLQQSPSLTHALPDARQVHAPPEQRPKQHEVKLPHDEPRLAQPNGRQTPLSQFPLQHC